MDRRTLDRRAHQLRYGLPTDQFLQRGADTRVNDIWAFLHDPTQRWYFTSQLDANTAYAFDTLSTPHGSFVLPGEALAEDRYRRLTQVIDAVARRDAASASTALAADVAPRDPPATEPLRGAIAAMEAALEEARADLAALCRRERARRAADRVIRKSIEMRALVLMVP
jgi:hypothetical protein